MDAEATADARTQRLRRASRASFAVALTIPAVATLAGWITEPQGALIVGTLLLPLLFGAMLANLLGWRRTLADKARIYLAIGSLFATWSAAEVLATAATPEARGGIHADVPHPASRATRDGAGAGPLAR